jgi:hypothetical protein
MMRNFWWAHFIHRTRRLHRFAQRRIIRCLEISERGIAAQPVLCELTNAHATGFVLATILTAGNESAGRPLMRAALFALLALGATSAFDITPAAAQRNNPGPFSFYTPSGYAFCLRSLYGDDDCSYATYQQCANTASGIGLSCFANPALAYAPEAAYGEARPARKKRKQRVNY